MKNTSLCGVFFMFVLSQLDPIGRRHVVYRTCGGFCGDGCCRLRAGGDRGGGEVTKVVAVDVVIGCINDAVVITVGGQLGG